MTVLSNIITPSNVLTTTNTATVTNKTLTSPTVTGMTVSDGTANGVTYLNGSKVLTSGSALTFDGTNFAVVGGNATINRSTNTSRLTLGGSPSANWEGDIQFVTSNTQTNWRVSSNQVTSGAFTITPSTAGGGSTFTTPAVTIDNASNLGLGVTPSAWSSSFKAIETQGGSFVGASSTAIEFWCNSYYNGTSSLYKNTGFAAVYNMGSGSHKWYTAPSGTAGNTISFTQAMTLDASGNLGIGTTSPNRTGFTAPVLSITNGTSGILELIGTQAADGTVGQIAFYNTSGSDRIAQILGLRSGANNSGAITFQTNNAGTLAERARINSLGNLLIKCTSNPSASVFGSAFIDNGVGASVLYQSTSLTSANALQVFYNPNGNVGSVYTSGSSTTYSTSSDYRLKENIAPMTGALATVAQLKPCTYTWKVDGASGQGFIAHELQAVVPDAVIGEKDAVDDEGNIKPQGIDTSFLVATLTSALQELNAKFEAYVASHP